MDSISGALLGEMNDEIMEVKNALKKKFPDINVSRIISCKDRIKEHYGDQVEDYSTLKSTFNSSTFLAINCFPISIILSKVLQQAVHSQ